MAGKIRIRRRRSSSSALAVAAIMAQLLVGFGAYAAGVRQGGSAERAAVCAAVLGSSNAVGTGRNHLEPQRRQAAQKCLSKIVVP